MAGFISTFQQLKNKFAPNLQLDGIEKYYSPNEQLIDLLSDSEGGGGTPINGVISVAYDKLTQILTVTYYDGTKSSYTLNYSSEQIDSIIEQLSDVYTKGEVDQLLLDLATETIHLLDPMSTESELLTTSGEIGDMREVVDTGKFYIYTPSGWHSTSGVTNLTNYYTKSETDSLFDKYVGLTGDESISGVKTFNVSPIVPIPVSNTEVANKIYVDEQVSNLKSEIDGKPVIISRIIQDSYNNITYYFSGDTTNKIWVAKGSTYNTPIAGLYNYDITSYSITLTEEELTDGVSIFFVETQTLTSNTPIEDVWKSIFFSERIQYNQFVDLSNYYTKTEIDTKLTELKDYIDSKPTLQDPETFQYVDTNIFQLSKIPTSIIEVRVRNGNESRWTLDEEDYSLDGYNITINYPNPLTDGMTVKVLYKA